MSIHSYNSTRDDTIEDCCEDPTPHTDLMAQAQPDLLGDDEALRLAELFKALADPTRVRIVAALSHTELCVDDLAQVLGMNQSAVSHQLRLLRHLQLVAFRRAGRHAFYRLDDDHVRDLFRRSREHLSC